MSSSSKPNIKAIASDIDGTLTDMSRVLSSATVETIRKLSVPIVLVTGNTHCFTRAAAVMLGSRHFVAENGGVISCEDKIEVVADRSLPDRAYELLRQKFGVKKFDSRYRLTDLVIVLQDGWDIGASHEFLVGHGLAVDLIHTGFAVHIKNKGITKGSGLRLIAQRMGLSTKDFAAIGDSDSDISMMHEAGYAAAVSNATPEVKAAADYVAKAAFGDGFAEAIDHLIAEDMIPAKRS